MQLILFFNFCLASVKNSLISLVIFFIESVKSFYLHGNVTFELRYYFFLIFIKEYIKRIYSNKKQFKPCSELLRLHCILFRIPQIPFAWLGMTLLILNVSIWENLVSFLSNTVGWWHHKEDGTVSRIMLEWFNAAFGFFETLWCHLCILNNYR